MTTTATHQPVTDASSVHSAPCPNEDITAVFNFREEDQSSISPILQFAWALVVSAYTDSNHVVFDLEVARSISTVQIEIQPEHTVEQVLSRSLDVRNGDNNTTISRTSFPTKLTIHSTSTTDNTTNRAQESEPGEAAQYLVAIEAVIQEEKAFLRAHFGDPRLAKSVINQLVYVLNSIKSDPSTALKHLQGASPRDLDQIKSWNKRVPLRHSDSCIHEDITKQCLKSPSTPAIAAWDGNLTYAQLDSLSTSLAARLIERGHGPDKFIGLFQDKSLWTAVSLLAVLKVGSAFFLIEPSLPDQRIKRMCEIAETTAIITSPDLSARAKALCRPVLIARAECEVPVTAGLSLPEVTPTHPAYVAFTSGSTGDPKAVLVEHGAVCSGMPAYAARLDLNKQSRIFQFASYSFVISVLDHLSALMNGACLCVASSDQIQNDLTGTLRTFSADFVEITPSVARVLDPDAMPSLKTVVLTGEAATRADLNKWTGRVELKTCYGQSENSLGALLDHKTDKSTAADMGYPWAAHCWVVNRSGDDLVPIGAEGELWLEGPSLARGYLNNEEQTAASFITDPTWMEKVRPGESARFLKTGDIVRYQPETGLLQYVGRRGSQVKLRGQRIELAEVEVQLKTQFSEADAAIVEIVSPEQDDSNAILVGFVTVSNERMSSDTASASLFAPMTADFASQTQRALKQMQIVLPRFMVPTTIVPLAALPLTPSGKLNRKLLRSKASELGGKLQTYHLLSEKSHRPALTEDEFAIRDLCADILNISPQEVNLNSSFFEMGGNSITSMKLVSTARERGFGFTTAAIFKQLSLAELAAQRRSDGAFEAVRRSEDMHQFKHLIPPGVDSNNVSDIFSCPRGQQWLFDHIDGGCFILRFSGPLNLDRLRGACHNLVQTHSVLRSLFIRPEGKLVQIILKDIALPFNIHPNTTRDPVAVARDLCAVDPQTAFPLGEVPSRFTLIPGRDETEHVLAIRLSHAQYDGICQETLVSDLCTLYRDPTASLEPTTLALYASEITRQQSPEAFEFWKTHLAGSTVTQYPSPSAYSSTQKPDEEPIAIKCSSTVPITTPPPKGITLATIVKAAWSHVLRQSTSKKDNDIVFSQLISLRDLDNIPHLPRTIGACLNRVPVRVKYNEFTTAKATATVSDLLHSVQAQHAETLPFRAVEWHDIVGTSLDWELGIRNHSLLIHQNFSATREFEFGGGLGCELVDYVAIEPPLRYIEVISEERERGGELGVSLVSSTGVIGEGELEEMLGLFCRTITRFLEEPGGEI